MSHLNLVKEYSDTQYPYSQMETFNEPTDGQDRLLLQLSILETIREASIKTDDVKILDGYLGIDVLFRKAVDHEHYMALSTQEPDEPLTLLLELPENRQYPNEAKRLLKWVHQAAKESQSLPAIDASIDPVTYDVIVYAKNMASYFKLWQTVPEHRRNKIADALILA